MRLAAALLLAIAGCGAGATHTPPATSPAGTWRVEQLEAVLGEVPWTSNLTHLVVDADGVAFVAPSWRTSSAAEVLESVYAGAGELVGFVRELHGDAAAVRWSWRSTFPEFAEEVALEVLLEPDDAGAAAARLQVVNTSTGTWLPCARLVRAR